MTKKDLLNKLRRLKKALPTDLVYINRVIDNKHVQVPSDYNVTTVDEFIEKDIQSVVSLGGSVIRPILGMFGSGKTTLLNRIETLLPKLISIDKYLLIRINLENVPVVQHVEFIKVLGKQIFPVLETEHFKEMFGNTDEEDLAKIFQSIEIVKYIKNLYSTSTTERMTSRAYFYDEIKEERIFQVVEGLIQLAQQNGKITCILVDELESLITQDKVGVLTEIIVSRFLRGIIDRRDTSVYIAFTCYKEKYEELRENFYKFYRITEDNEIKLMDLSAQEKRELTESILYETMEFTFGKLGVDEVLNQFKGKLDFYMSHVVKLIVSKIFEYIDQSQEIWKQVQDLYEKNAREQNAIPQLLDWGFNRANIRNQVEEVAGYHFDIFASETHRGEIVKRAFGEIKSVICNKRWAEKFCNWMDMQILLKSGEYVKDRDHLLFIAPDYTADALRILEAKGVKCIEYQDVSINKILEEKEREKVKDLSEVEKEVIAFLKETRSGCRTYNVMQRKFPKELLEELARKGKIIIKRTKKGQKVCIKK
ncbi:MAG: hypothetical protein HWN65_14475 [Candidatus Helarchaeota archaeon]|nr:hypothetical protein [Candidatus Helarchaeota archaeon]